MSNGGSPGSVEVGSDREEVGLMDTIDHQRCRYPYCIVWTPIPVITWLLPFIGHMGICMSNGVIRDFAGPYFVSEDDMAFGKPTKYLQLSAQYAHNGRPGWDAAVTQASQIYNKRMHIIVYDNCHSHVATALDLMCYKGSKNWNMVSLAARMLVFGKYVGVGGFLKSWLPSILFYGIITTLWLTL